MSARATRVLAGVDGCRSGWVAAVSNAAGGLSLAVHPTLGGLVEALPADAVIAVDMPIGLPERIEGAGRVAEIAARARLRRRRSSIFPIPARAAFAGAGGPFATPQERSRAYRSACEAARRHSAKGRAFAIQAFGIFPKILEVDALLRADPPLRERVIESHPELAFAVLNGGAEMRLPKKARDGEAWPGLAERRAVLGRHGLPDAFLDARPPGRVGRDDWLDACALLLVAARFAEGTATPHPDPPGRDAHGLPIAIWV